MLTEENQILNFGDFLLSHFGLVEAEPLQKEELAPSKCACATSCDCKNRAKEENKARQIEANTSPSDFKAEKKGESQIVLKKEDKNLFELEEDEVQETKKDSVKSLSEVIESIPDRVRSLDIEELSHKHENEWYHAFRDLKEDLVKEVSAKHSHKSSVLKHKKDIKGFTEQFDDQIDKVMLEVERIFQAWPNMSRVAVIYLLAIVVSIPLVFISGVGTEQNALDYARYKTSQIPQNSINIDQDTKASFIRENAQQILSSKEKVYKVSEGTAQTGRVAGAYEEDIEVPRKLRVDALYKQIADIKDEFEYFLKNNFGN